MEQFEILVQNSQTCIKLLRYVDKNIDDINQLRAEIIVRKIDANENSLEKLKSAGINRLPALVLPDGKSLIGIDKIMDMLSDNLNDLRNQNRIASKYGGPATNSEFGNNPDLTDWYQRELFEGFDDKRGIRKPRKDDDESDFNDALDIERKMSDYNRNVPKHRREAGRERNIDNRRGGRDFDDDDDDEDHYDNVYDSDESSEEDPPPRKRGRGGGGGRRDNIRVPNLGRGRDAAGDELDQRMMNAWMDNRED